ncbi:ribosomal protein S18 acetylase RimI-like enzyme [Paenibacillus endophyticus]|uniref:Ribosomal protein S18 acetylase RimI-like enzyme n=1 Tax=Paenibacillus endophyticus TaxID=1294268 RepID=A0A7W5C2L4_9BACL|nr:GNAT family N-acetyltransferase [Paenibacillus endophyticus]MBB3150092.1 ribosomal protein S18 acetylase RimI-like enzyme [Paenibacillus endophyticus]
MDLELLTPETWLAEQKRLIGFSIRFGDKRLAVSTIHALRKLDPSLLQPDLNGQCGAAAIIAKHGSRIVGFGFAEAGGEAACMVVVHPEARSLGIGSSLVQAMIKRLGKLSCNVAVDNTASMALCFRLGMTAVSMHRGPTGKPTLRFERGTAHDSTRPRHPDFIPQ